MKLLERIGLWLRGAPPSVHAQLRRRMRSAPRRAIAAVRDDAAARMVGIVRARETIAAPLSGQPCVAYHLAFEGGEEIGLAPFALDDGSATVDVDPEGGWMTLDHRLPAFEDPPYLLPEPVKQAMLRAGRPPHLLAPGILWTWASEGRIEPGDRVALVGAIERLPVREATADYRRNVAHTLRMISIGGVPIMLSNAPETMS